MQKYFFIVAYFLIVQYSIGQTIQPLQRKDGVSIRGLSILDDRHAWVSGSKGTIGHTDDGGNSWAWIRVKDYEKSDFRDIELLDSNTAIIMAIDSPAVILKTYDKGHSWQKVLEDKRKGMFMDAMHFNHHKAIVVGDPIEGKLFLATSDDGGNHWQTINDAPKSVYGCFASSGTNIVWKNNTFIVVTGGENSYLWWQRNSYKLPLTMGKETTGANSIAQNPNPNATIAAIVVGGDFMNKNQTDSNTVLIPNTFFSHKNPHFISPSTPPTGYKSCVLFLDENKVIATGTSGTDISSDKGNHWQHIADTPYHVVQKSKKGNLVLLAGPDGTIARFSY